jgi:tetratricopeptide (TPR) repeat protein
MHRRLRQPDEVEGAPGNWGGVARRGAARLNEAGSASSAWRAANEAARESSRRTGSENEDGEDESTGAPAEAKWQPESWVDHGVVRDEAEDAVRRGLDRSDRRRPARKKPSGGRTAPKDDSVAPAMPASLLGGTDDEVEAVEREARHDQLSETAGDELRTALGTAKGDRAEKRMREAGEAFRRGRFEEARRILRPIAETAPRVAPLRELYGLTLYRLGRWKQAALELEAFRTQTASTDQHPVLADCYRALGRYDDVEALWDELRAASPSSELVAEGRIVAAGALADQGRLDEALALLAPAVKATRKAKPHHLRIAYALADLYERAGDLPRARELFERVAGVDPEFVDVQSRIDSLR